MKQGKTENDHVRILIDFLRLLMSPQVTTPVLINYMKHHHIDVNVYLPSLQGECQLPLIYYSCSRDNLQDFITYLIEQHVDLQAPMLCQEVSQQIELLYYSQISYIPLLIQHGCHLKTEQILQQMWKNC